MGVLEINNNCFYSSNDEDYYYLYSDHIKYSTKLFENILKFIKKTKNIKILDACCGIGTDMEFFHKNNFKIDGSDICPEMVSYSSERLRPLSYNGKVFVCDVLNLKEKLSNNKYDLILFRGNTLGHLNQQEQIEALNNLLGVLNKDGLLLIDFRVGEIHFKEKRKFEFRGTGFGEKGRNIFFSYYKLNHPEKITDFYSITAFTYIFNYAQFKFTKLKRNILGNYVLQSRIDNYLKKSKHNILWQQDSNKGLKYLKTYLIRN